MNNADPRTSVRRRLPPTVWKLGWVSFFADVSSEMVYPLLPLFMRNVLKAPVAALGLVEGVAEAVVSIMKGWSGWHSDRKGKRVPYVRWGYGLSAVGKPLIALAAVWPMVLFARVTDRVGKGIRTTARDALMADAVDADMRGAAFGLHRGMDTAGALVGTAVAAALLYWVPGQYRWAFLLAAIPGLVSVWLTLLLRDPRPEAPEPSSQAPQEHPPSKASSMTTREILRSLPRSYWIVLATVMVFAIANSSDTFLLLRASELFRDPARSGGIQLGITDTLVVLAYGLYNLSYMLSSYPAGILSDRIGRWWLIGVGWVIYACVYAGFALVRTPAPVWGLFAFYGLYIGMTKGVESALVADHSPKELRGSAMGLFHMCSGLATILASGIAGVGWDLFGPSAAFGLGAAMAAAAVLLVPIAARACRLPTGAARGF